MADFRKKMLVLASLAVIGAASASAQNFSCNAAPANPLQMRAEGITEPAGDVLLTCTGNTPGLNFINLTVTLNTAITSRLQASGLSEAAVLVNEPQPGLQYTANNAATIPPQVQNVFYGSQTAVNQVTFLALPTTLGPGNVAIYRITNIRANASALGVAPGGALPNNVIENVSSSTGFLIINPSQTVGAVLRGLNASTVTGAANFLQCVGSTSASAFTVNVSEGFATAFKDREIPGHQNTPGDVRNTESMFEVGVPAFTTAASPIGQVGAADTATRFQIVLTNIQNGVTIAPPTSAPSPNGAIANLISYAGGVAIYEIASAQPFSLDSFAITFPVSYTASPSTNSPGLGGMNVAVSFNPTSTITVASPATVPIPRFVDTSSPLTGFTVTACSTTLLFPFVSNIAGFDTGIAISNTSTDPFGALGALPQSGTCMLTFYGSGAPASPFTTAAAVASGTAYTTLASTVAPGFQGYMFAQCAFQYGHGFAFITDGFGGPGRGLSQGYLALVIPDPTQIARTPVPGSAHTGPSLPGEALFQ